MSVEPAIGSIARAARVLEVLASAGDDCSLSELSERTAFSKTTTHRVLGSLQAVRYVSQDPESRTYRLGIGLAELARLAHAVDLGALAQRGMRRLAALTDDTVFLSVTEGPTAVCIAREVGDFPIRTLTLDRGDRRPLGIGAGSLALYCAMTKERRTVIGRINKDWLRDYGASEETLEAQAVDTKARGYALNRGGVVPGMSAVALPVVTANGEPVAGLAIGAINDRMTDDRIASLLLPALHEEVADLAARINCLDSSAEAQQRLTAGEIRT
ncbi:MAG: IclR family transcriptional regulator [Pseudomonadota bacterium]